MEGKIFAYCERGLDSGFWAEPLNALTNGAFVLAGLAAFALIARQRPADRQIVDIWLAALLCVIGVGSFLFHTFATPWAGLADTLPIAVLMLSYLAMAMRRFLGASWWWTAAGLVAFLAAYGLAGQVRCDGARCLNGSVGYLPALAALLLIGGWLMARRHPAGRSLVVAAAIFAVSLTCRSLDRVLCDDVIVAGVPIGLHFMWHVLNAAVLYILVRAAILDRGRANE
jgi:Ceramidase